MDCVLCDRIEYVDDLFENEDETIVVSMRPVVAQGH